MSKFLTTLKSEQLGRWIHKLLDELVYQDEEIGVVRVPVGFHTDFASIQSLHNAFLFALYALVSGYGNYASTVHDYLYVKGTYSRKQSDAVFYRALRAEGVARWRSYLFWLGVRVGGRKAWDKHRGK